ncbi:MAG: endonuclease III [Planctomycetes bacterium]|nr:endonuclease III [Planctomycetota bacterium]
MAKESKENLARRFGKVYAILEKTYPDAKCRLEHGNPFEMLIATILSAQCTDERVNIVCKSLFRKYRCPADFAASPPGQLENDIRSTGFFNNKAKNIRGACSKIIGEFGGKVPDTMEQLLTLPGVARKTANVVLGNAFGKNEGIVVDTHVLRLAGRFGFSRHADPVKIEQDLMALCPRKNWALLSHLLIFHGRAYCTARKPDCPECPASKLCPSAGKA